MYQNDCVIKLQQEKNQKRIVFLGENKIWIWWTVYIVKIEIWDAEKGFCQGSPIIDSSRAFKRISGLLLFI